MMNEPNDTTATLAEFMDVFSSNFIQLFDDMLGLSLTVDQQEDELLESFLSPDGMIIIIDFAGACNGFFAVTMSEQTIANILNAGKLPSKSERQDIREEHGSLLKEMLNSVSGDCISVLEKQFRPVTISTPKIIYGSVSYSRVPCLMRRMVTPHGKISCNVCIDNMALEVNRMSEKIKRWNEELRDSVAKLGNAQASLIGVHKDTSRIVNRLKYYPLSSAGGDFFSCYKLTDQRYFILMTDVSGHDLGAAFISSYFQGFAGGMMNENIKTSEDLEKFFSGINSFLIKEWNANGWECSKSIVVCGILLDYDKMDATTYLSGACLPVHVNEGDIGTLGDVSGAPLGWFEEDFFQKTVCPFSLKSNFYIWSDGVEELADLLKVNIFSIAYKLFELESSKARPDWLSGIKDDFLLVEVSSRQESDLRDEYETFYFKQYFRALMRSVEDIKDDWVRSLKFSIGKFVNKAAEKKVSPVLKSMFGVLIREYESNQNMRLVFSMQYSKEKKMIRIIFEDINKEKERKEGTLGFIDHLQEVGLPNGFSGNIVKDSDASKYVFLCPILEVATEVSES